MLRISFVKLLALAMIVSAIFSLVMFVSWHRDRERLAAIAQAVAPAGLSPGEKAERLNAWIYANQGFAKNPRYFLWDKLEATPIDVLAHGGDCEDKSKLLVAMLDTVGVEGTMAMQYPCRTCSPVHTVVLADIGDRLAAYDPVYNISFPDGRGGYHDVRSLRAQPQLMNRRLDELVRLRGQTDKIAHYNPANHSYAHITTVNWDKNGLTRAVAAGLTALGQEPALTTRPFFLDNPKEFFAVAGAVMALGFAFLLLVTLLVRRLRRPRPAAGAYSAA